MVELIDLLPPIHLYALLFAAATLTVTHPGRLTVSTFFMAWVHVVMQVIDGLMRASTGTETLLHVPNLAMHAVVLALFLCAAARAYIKVKERSSDEHLANTLGILAARIADRRSSDPPV